MGKVLIIAGIIILSIGILVHFQDRIPIGRLPGDLKIKGENYTIYFPIATSIILSIVISVVLYLISKSKQ